MSSAIGKLIGPYRLELPLATGALGQTLRALHTVTGEVVAVKLFHEGLSTDHAFAERFRPIVQAAADIRHPNVLPIRDFGVQSGQHYILMDFIPTGSLRTLLSQRDTRLPLRRALDLARQSAEGIAAAHGRGVLHRDLKPENILIEERGALDVVRVADFGLTRLAESGLTIAGSLAVGSLPYMSPEQLRGVTIDARSDVYSLGVVLYELATGYPPFQVQNLGDAISKHVSAAPPSPRSLLPSIPASLEQLILRALEKNPANRIQTIAEFSTLLQEEIGKLPGQPLVVWRGAEIAPPSARVLPKRDNGSASSRKRFALRPAEVAGNDPTLPPPVELKGEGRKLIREPSGDSRRIGVVLEREALTLVPGQPSVLTVTLMNSGRTVDAFSLSVRGVDESWVQTPSQPHRLNPGQRAVVPLNILVPRVSASRAGTYPATIVAGSRENPGEEGSAPATFTVQPFANSMLLLVPPKSRGWTRGRFAVALSNQGNAPAKYALSGQDDEKALDYRLSATAALEPGETLDVPLVTAARLRPIGIADIRTFTVTATSQIAGGLTEPPKSVVGQFVHRAVIPMWLPPLLLAGGVAAFFFWKQQEDLKKQVVSIVPQAMQLAVGTSAPLVATVTNMKNEVVPSTTPVTWTSRDTLIASVSDSGVVTGRHEGPTIITAQFGKQSKTVQVAVSPASLEQVSVSPKRLTLSIGSMAVLRATAKDATGRQIPRDAIWLSSDPTVATVGGGRVTAKGPGTATITAQIEAKSATADVTVPAPPPPIEKKEGPKGPDEDCIAYEPSSIAVSNDKVVGWRVADGQTVLATLDRESEAKQALALARRFKKRCFIGRQNTRLNRSDYITDYWAMPTNVVVPIPNEVCRRYDRVSLSIKEQGAAGFSVEDQDGRLVWGDTRADAQKVWNVAKDYTSLCVIGDRNGRPNKRDYMVQYWR
ncbi:MAG: protein kinase [Gemmatimonadaceae bacterium]